MNREVDENKIKGEVIKEIEPRIEYEIQKIKSEQVKLNLREFEMVFTQLRALVEATHNRAWKGEERGSLRRHFNISEIIGGRPQQQEKKKWGLFKIKVKLKKHMKKGIRFISVSNNPFSQSKINNVEFILF